MRANLFAALLATLVPSVAFSQPRVLPDLDLERLELDPSATGSLAVGGARLLAPAQIRLFLAGHYARNPLLLAVDGAPQGAVISDRTTLHLGLAVGIHPRLELGFGLSGVVDQRSPDLERWGLVAPSTAGFRAPSVYARTRLLSTDSAQPLDLAFQVGMEIPIGSGDALASTRSFAFTPKVLAARAFADWGLHAELGGYFGPSAQLGESMVGSRLGGALALTRVFGPFGAEAGIRGFLPLTEVPASAEPWVGARYTFASRLQAFGLVAAGLGNSPGTPSMRGVLGLAYSVGGPAARPAEPAPVVPEAPAPEIVPVVAAAPIAPSDPDTDGDGTLDSKDLCRNEAGPAENQGCPWPDSDADGLPDHLDLCVNEPGTNEERGCPIRDQDGDGIPDREDNCPAEKGVAENQGCPAKRKQLVVITRDRLVIKDKVYFATNRALIQKKSFGLLDQIFDVIKSHPWITRIVVEGHTDARGKADRNRQLSQERADSVRAYLIQRGVAPELLEAKGYGPDRPIASNETAKGREENRRVEFIIPGGETVEVEVTP